MRKHTRRCPPIPILSRDLVQWLLTTSRSSFSHQIWFSTPFKCHHWVSWVRWVGDKIWKMCFIMYHIECILSTKKIVNFNTKALFKEVSISNTCELLIEAYGNQKRWISFYIWSGYSTVRYRRIKQTLFGRIYRQIKRSLAVRYPD